MVTHIHLDAVGGVSGDMFVGALLSCWPECAGELAGRMEEAGFGGLVSVEIGGQSDGVLTGTRFVVKQAVDALRKTVPHAHRHYAEIRDTLSGSRLDTRIKRHAIGIFHELAQAEARVHGMEVEKVAFHEVGAWDSIADIVCAACLIEAAGGASWSVSSLPMGKGRVPSAHGALPVPAPAVVELLKGFQFHDDGLEGERVTPTGAAILKYLEAGKAGPASGLVLADAGHGFGARRFPGISNVLRALVYTAAEEKELPWREEDILALSFEVDDQTPEELALALDYIRREEGVLDVSQAVAGGKKDRLSCQVRVLVAREAEVRVIAACFNETTTLGVRKEPIRRVILPREERVVARGGKEYRVKIVRRPGGHLTAKADLDGLREEPGHAARKRLREEIEALAIKSMSDEEGGDTTKSTSRSKGSE